MTGPPGAPADGPKDTAAAGQPPLTARSVILSVLLGSHPPALPVRTLIRLTDLFGITEGTTRVALSRLTSEGELTADNGVYALSARLVDRQRAQDAAIRPPVRPWDGETWEIALAAPDVSTAAERAALGADLAGLRLAELRPGVWLRPANLDRVWPAALRRRAWPFASRPGAGFPPPRDLTAQLWDLDGWAAGAAGLTAQMEALTRPAPRFVVAAAMVRHLRADPLLPDELLPPAWPGERLRDSYDRYRRELGQLMQRERDRG